MGYRTAPPKYFRLAFDYLRYKLGAVIFFVSTDREDWFKTEVRPSADVIMLRRQPDAATDMALLASFDHLITSVGTFSWWAGYLNKGTVLYWKDFIANGTQIGKFFADGKTFIPPHWIGLSC
jgi:galactoside 2-L-fucosyltransferase 1/2